jgi:STE24 endopeptidase
MSERTAARTRVSLWGPATIALLGTGWLVAASYLWRTRVPDDLETPHLQARDYFTASELDKAADYERFVRTVMVISIVATLVALVVLAWRLPRLARSTGLGPIGAGMIVGMVMLVVLWAVDLPFSIALRWWGERHDLQHGSWFEWLIEPWAVLGGSIGFIMLQIAIVMGFARRFPRTWWVPTVPVFLLLTGLALFVSPYLLAFGIDRPVDPQLRSDARMLAKKVGAAGTPVDVEEVSNLTTQANAFASGLGPTRRIVLYDTLLDGRFEPGEVRTVVAHEYTHIARRHLWKGIGWTVLFAFPFAFLVAELTRRRGGLGDPAVLPYGALVLVVVNLAFTPLLNVISRRYESEADWGALQATHDPQAAEDLFNNFSKTSLAEPDPPEWDRLLFGTHPTLLERIEMAEAWKRRR